MAQFEDAGAGVATATSGAALSPSCPATVNAGDLLLAHACYRDTSTTPSTPSGFTLLSGPHDSGSPAVGRHWVFGKIADGSEDGASVSFGTAAVTIVRHARVYRFSGVHQTLATAVAGFAHAAANTTSILDTGVTTPEDNALAGQLVYMANDDPAIGAFTGETGGDWTEAVQFTTDLGSDGTMQLQTAAMASAGTINGGAFSLGATRSWGVLGFYVLSPAAATTPIDADALDLARDVRAEALGDALDLQRNVAAETTAGALDLARDVRAEAAADSLEVLRDLRAAVDAAALTIARDLEAEGQPEPEPEPAGGAFISPVHEVDAPPLRISRGSRSRSALADAVHAAPPLAPREWVIPVRPKRRVAAKPKRVVVEPRPVEAAKLSLQRHVYAGAEAGLALVRASSEDAHEIARLRERAAEAARRVRDLTGELTAVRAAERAARGRVAALQDDVEAFEALLLSER